MPNLDLYKVPRFAKFDVAQKLIFIFDAPFKNPRLVILRSNTENLLVWEISSTTTWDSAKKRLEIDATPKTPTPPFAPTIPSPPGFTFPSPGGDSDLSITIIDEDTSTTPPTLTIDNHILYFAIRFLIV